MLKPVVGTWFEFRHHTACEGKYWDKECAAFTAKQWEEKIAEIASLGMKYLVLMSAALKLPDEEECYFESDIYPMAKLGCDDPMRVMFETCDKYDMKVFVSCGYYGIYVEPYENMTSLEVRGRAFKAMEQLYARYGHYKSFYGWYYPDETCIEGHFQEEFVDYVNVYSAKAHELAPHTKTMIAPYGTNIIVTDDKYVDQLKRLDVDIVAYQDEVGVQKATPEQTAGYYKALKEAHDKAGRSKIWADVEFFDFEGQVYRSALIPADTDRVIKQLEAVSPYVEEILCYQYQGMMNKPGTNAYCGSENSEKLYNAIKEYNESTKK